MPKAFSSRNKRTSFAALVNLLLFGIFLLLTKQIYDTNEDVYVLYLLSGGFGSPPTELLHYNHLMHPLLNILLKTLFQFTNQINWYSLALISSHFAALTIILSYFLKSNRLVKSLSIYLLLFVTFECQFLLNINFSNTAIVLGCSGLIVILNAGNHNGPNLKYYITGLLLLLAASLFRIHVLIPLFGITLPFIFLRKSKTEIFLIPATVLTAGVLIFISNQIHQSYYKANIANWNQEEQYRQTIYRFYNHLNLNTPEVGQTGYTELNLIKNGLPIDTSFLSMKKINQIFLNLKSSESSQKPLALQKDSKNWFLVNNRIFFITILFVIVFNGKKRLATIAISALVLLVAGMMLLIHEFGKVPGYLMLGCLFFIGSMVAINQKNLFPERRSFELSSLTVALLITMWGVIRIYKNNLVNIAANEKFQAAYTSIQQYPDRLFIDSGDEFPIQKFSIMDLPKNYPLKNFLSSEHFLHNIYLPTFQRFHLEKFRNIPFSKNVFFWGNKVPALEQYFLSTNKNHQLFYLTEQDYPEIYCIRIGDIQ